MTDLFPKFIISNDSIILSRCTFHNELAVMKEEVKGGGWFELKEDTFTFYGSSDEFGEASIDDIKKAVQDNKVYTNPYTEFSIGKKFKFKYKTGSNEIIDLN